jgi:hypothetical protein
MPLRVRHLGNDVARDDAGQSKARAGCIGPDARDRFGFVCSEPVSTGGQHRSARRWLRYEEFGHRSSRGRNTRPGILQRLALGAEGECRRLAIVSLQVVLGEETLFVPRSAFADLGSPSRISVKRHGRRFDIVVIGGDAATSYAAGLRFWNSGISSRRVESGEFNASGWEETTFASPR